MSSIPEDTFSRVCAPGADTPSCTPPVSLKEPSFDGNDDDAYRILQNEELDDDNIWWYPMRVRFATPKRTFDLRDRLCEKGFATYVRLEDPKVDWTGKVEYSNKPAICNLIFVRARKKILRHIKNTDSSCVYLQFMSKGRRMENMKTEIIHVDDRAMRNFISAETRPDPDRQRIPLTYTDFMDKQGKRVRILRGPFRNIEGEVKRVQGHRIVVVLLRETQLAMGITHIDPKDLELL